MTPGYELQIALLDTRSNFDSRGLPLKTRESRGKAMYTFDKQGELCFAIVCGSVQLHGASFKSDLQLERSPISSSSFWSSSSSSSSSKHYKLTQWAILILTFGHDNDKLYSITTGGVKICETCLRPVAKSFQRGSSPRKFRGKWNFAQDFVLWKRLDTGPKSKYYCNGCRRQKKRAALTSLKCDRRQPNTKLAFKISYTIRRIVFSTGTFACIPTKPNGNG